MSVTSLKLKKENLNNLNMRYFTINILLLLLTGCVVNQHLNDVEKKNLEGYHANEANRIIDLNIQNKEANKKDLENYKKEQLELLKKLNESKKNKKSRNTGEFKVI